MFYEIKDEFLFLRVVSELWQLDFWGINAVYLYLSTPHSASDEHCDLDRAAEEVKHNALPSADLCGSWMRCSLLPAAEPLGSRVTDMKKMSLSMQMFIFM